MSKLEIPESWASSELYDLCEFIRNGFSLKQNKDGKGCPVSRIETIAAGEIDFNRIGFGDIAKDRKEQYRLQKGDILFSHINSLEHIGKTALFQSDRELYHGMNLLCMRPKSPILPKFLTYFLKSGSTREYFRSKCKRAINQVSINTKEVGALNVPVPPIGEQNRIVAKIESTQEKIKTIESSISKAEELIEKYRESLLQKAFRGELVPLDPNDEPASKLIERIHAEKAKQSNGKKAKKDELPPIKSEEIPFQIPKSWEWVRLGSVLELLTDYHANGAYEKLKEQVQIKDTPDYAIMVRTTNFSERGRGKYIYISKSAYDFLPKSKLLPGDLIMNKIADPGAVFMTEDLGQPMTLAMNLFLLRFNPRLANNFYFFEYLKLNEAYIKTFSKGATTKTITKDAVRNLIIPLPPINEQIRIMDVFKSANKSIQFTRSAFAECSELISKLKIGTLEKAFCGELVPQVSAEGTGHELLEKIKGEQLPVLKNKAGKKTSTSAKMKRAKK